MKNNFPLKEEEQTPVRMTTHLSVKAFTETGLDHAKN